MIEYPLSVSDWRTWLVERPGRADDKEGPPHQRQLRFGDDHRFRVRRRQFPPIERIRPFPSGCLPPRHRIDGAARHPQE